MYQLASLAADLEKVSQIYATRHAIARDDDWFLLKLQEEVGELTQAYLRFTGRSKLGPVDPDEHRTNLADEAADVICHALLLARHCGLDFDAAIQRKWLTRLNL